VIASWIVAITTPTMSGLHPRGVGRAGGGDAGVGGVGGVGDASGSFGAGTTASWPPWLRVW